MRIGSETSARYGHEAERQFMARALELAEAGRYTARPNPCVGCVIVAAGEIVAEGFHARAGEPHAEVHALRAAGERARGATAYVSLEPCAHHGRTPPCAEALIAAGVIEVIYACEDPFPQVAGRGAARLASAGIRVRAGLLRAEAREANRGFLARIERGRPWLRLKLAQSLDGRLGLADGRSQWLSGDAARADVQRWRARSCAILTGSGTVLADDPQLTVRDPALGEVRPPLRLVLDRRGRLRPGLKLLSDGLPTRIYGPSTLPGADCRPALEPLALLEALAAEGINEIQVEAGPGLSAALLAAGLVDELLIYQAPRLLGRSGVGLRHAGDAGPLAPRPAWCLLSAETLGDDVRLLLRPRP